MRTILVIVYMINAVTAFFSIRPFKPPRLPHTRTALRMNYLDSISASNNSTGPYALVTQPKYNPPIPIVSFDDIFLKLHSIDKVFMSGNSDRIIVCYGDKKGVYYINTKKELKKIEFILSLINADVKIIMDYPTHMDTPSGLLYCSPRITKLHQNMSNEEMEDLINDVINKYEDEISEENDEEDDGFDEGDFEFY